MSISVTESIEIGTHALDAPPHDGSGNGYIKIGASYSFKYYETGWRYACGDTTNVSYVAVERNRAARVISWQECHHEE